MTLTTVATRAAGERWHVGTDPGLQRTAGPGERSTPITGLAHVATTGS
jgi:hypothetical protein